MSLAIAFAIPRRELYGAPTTTGHGVRQSLPTRRAGGAPCKRRPNSRLASLPLVCTRRFSATRHQYQSSSGESYGSRLGKAWRGTRIQWKPIPIGLGIGFLGFTQLYRVQQREKRRQEEEELLASDGGEPEGPGGRPKKRKKIRPTDAGLPVRIMSYLPLKGISRIWGWFNELTIPYYLRVPGFRLYSWIFGVKYDPRWLRTYCH